ncbi:hypothetical protein HRI_002594400 [Hibiscus trionum]|uniref:Uncharacterized protein n=1 Tax=Hibiscus trionum TaxID=183268 RepID=A0A9W7I5F7_HIBTR|nr:hypothetical protein HRI_002594400 [Hibiscus trionum]
MAEKKWILLVSLAFMVAMSPLTSRIIELRQAHRFYIGELIGMVLGKLQGWTQFNGGANDDTERERAIGPNMIASHQSYGQPDLLVYCCPLGFEKSVPFVDFKFPDPRSPVKVRCPTHLLDESFIAKYNKDLSIMKSLPYDDPRTFLRQADLHC